jgi:hypothetical protein
MKSITMITLVTLFLIIAAFAEDAEAAEEAGREHEYEGGSPLFALIKPLGIATLCFVSATFLTGLFRRKLGKIFLRVHLPLAVISIVLGLAHGTLVLVLFG